MQEAQWISFVSSSEFLQPSLTPFQIRFFGFQWCWSTDLCRLCCQSFVLTIFRIGATLHMHLYDELSLSLFLIFQKMCLRILIFFPRMRQFHRSCLTTQTSQEISKRRKSKNVSFISCYFYTEHAGRSQFKQQWPGWSLNKLVITFLFAFHIWAEVFICFCYLPFQNSLHADHLRPLGQELLPFTALYIHCCGWTHPKSNPSCMHKVYPISKSMSTL